MLESIRNGVQKPWVKIVIFAIVISFIFAGYFTSSNFLGDPNAVAIVNGDSISRNEFQRAYRSVKSQQADYYNATVKTEEDERNFQENVKIVCCLKCIWPCVLHSYKYNLVGFHWLVHL